MRNRTRWPQTSSEPSDKEPVGMMKYLHALASSVWKYLEILQLHRWFRLCILCWYASFHASFLLLVEHGAKILSSKNQGNYLVQGIALDKVLQWVGWLLQSSWGKTSTQPSRCLGTTYNSEDILCNMYNEEMEKSCKTCYLPNYAVSNTLLLRIWES